LFSTTLLRGAGEFVAQVPYFPPLQSLEDDFGPDECLRLVRAAAAGAKAEAAGVAAAGGSGGDGFLADAEVRSVRSWSMSAEVADVFKRGRVILAGMASADVARHVIPCLFTQQTGCTVRCDTVQRMLLATS
jgi:hypothetical protein